MAKWYVVNDFGRIVAGPYFSKEVAKTFVHSNPMLNVVCKEDDDD